uniref:CCHC-type domain-containing protein n=1 Tax=Falco tinnunculus TaxID=100819 RepID=A0A8C4UZH5_FALTI
MNRGGERKNEQGQKAKQQLEKPLGGPSCRKMLQSCDLPPVCITVRPYNPLTFWQKVKAQALQEVNWDLSEVIDISVSEPAADTSVTMASPVARGDPAQGIMNERKAYSWKVIQDLQKCVAQYGPNSPAILQLIRLLTMEEITPYYIAMLVQVMFQPEQYAVFKTTWAQKADAQALRNLQFPQDDVHFGNGSDVLTGTGLFSNPQCQAQQHLLILEQVKAVGIEALIQMAELAEPKIAKYTMIQQGAREPFLQLVETLQAAVEKQVFDGNLRTVLVTQLVRDNANANCQKIIEALPGDPTQDMMIQACAKVGSVEHKMATLATTMAALKTKDEKCFSCCQSGHIKVACSNENKKGGTGRAAGAAVVTCHKCGKNGHFAKQCQSKFHLNGQPSPQGNGKKNVRGCGKTEVPATSANNPFLGHPQTRAFVTGYQGKPVDQPARMYPLLTQ